MKISNFYPNVLRGIIRKYSQLQNRPPFLVGKIVDAINTISGRKFLMIVKLSRFIKATSLNQAGSLQKQLDVPSLEILFVCAGKDLLLLPNSIYSAVKASAKHKIERVVVIIPSKDKSQTTHLQDCVDVPISIEFEEEYLSPSHFKVLREIFGNRSGWVVQQLLKILYVNKSESAGVLICDADTILLDKKIWLDSNGVQILAPSWEYTKNYYLFLSRFKLVDVYPKFTFVSHHMLMQPRFLRSALIFMNWTSSDRIINDLILNYDGKDQSPFCIDYELYAQYMLKFYPEKIQIVKWGNLGVSRQDSDLPKLLKMNYASVSLHDYLR